MTLQIIQRELVPRMEQLVPSAAGIKPLAALAPVMSPEPDGPAARDVSSYSGPRSHLPAWMRVSTWEKATSRPWIFSCAFTERWPLWRPKGPSSLGTRSQSGLGSRDTRKGRERSYHFQEAVNPKGMCQNSLATPRDRNIRRDNLPLCRLRNWGSPSSDLEKFPRIHCFTQLDNKWIVPDVELPCCMQDLALHV